MVLLYVVSDIVVCLFCFFFSSRRRHTRCALVTGVQTCALPIFATQMGCSVEDAAFDCWRVVNANMSQAVRRTVAGKGHDPKDMVMLAYGGNGPVFAAVQAEDLEIGRASCRERVCQYV